MELVVVLYCASICMSLKIHTCAMCVCTVIEAVCFADCYSFFALSV
jgi:hypothetical protein